MWTGLGVGGEVFGVWAGSAVDFSGCFAIWVFVEDSVYTFRECF